MSIEVRKAYVAGKFYPGTRLEITNLIEQLREGVDLKDVPEANDIIGGILPHAGYIYSGIHALHFFEYIKRMNYSPDIFVLLHPIHRGGVPDFASDSHRYWSTPLGKMEIDEEFVEAMGIERADEIHRWEHSGEVLLPFIQYYQFNASRLVPIGVCWQHPDSSHELAEKIIHAKASTGKSICLLASSDFSHFLSPEEGLKQDELAIEKILKIDPEGVFRRIQRNNISICGYGPIMTLLYYADSISDRPAVKILSRGHSGQVSPSESVVDYVSMLVYD